MLETTIDKENRLKRQGADWALREVRKILMTYLAINDEPGPVYKQIRTNLRGVWNDLKNLDKQK